MADENRKTSEKNSVETIVDINCVLWFNKKHIEEGLDHKNLRVTTVKYFWEHRNDKFRARLGFKQYDVILTKEQSVPMKINSHLKEKTCERNAVC